MVYHLKDRELFHRLFVVDKRPGGMKSILNSNPIHYRFAKIDPTEKSTNGMAFHLFKRGYGNETDNSPKGLIQLKNKTDG